LTATSTIPTATYQWFRNTSPIAGQVNLVLPNQTLGGDYRIVASFATCTDEATGTVTLRESTQGGLPSRALICPSTANPNPDTRQVVLNPDPNSNFVSFNWFKGGAPLGINTPTLTVTEDGIYSVDLVNLFGCPSSDQTEVIEECNPRIVAPTAFRPGSSISANDGFYLFTYFVDNEDFQLFIYNRWGEMIYQSDGLNPDIENQSKRWNGGYNNNAGQLLPAGTYSYVVRYRSSYRPEDGVKEQRGGVVLLR
jgi:hypothetical protein